MKMMYCQDCATLVVPSNRDYDIRWCDCRRHAVWWTDGARGILQLFTTTVSSKIIKERKYPPTPRAYVIGLANDIFRLEQTNAESIQASIDSMGDHYLFKRHRSLVIRVRPGETSDTSWAAELPT